MTTTLVGTPDDDNLYATYRTMHAERIAAVGRAVRAPLSRGMLFRAPLTEAARVIKAKKS